MRKLTDPQVAQIRELAAQGRSQSALADEFGVSRRHIGRLLRGEQRQKVGGQIGGLHGDLVRGSVVQAVNCFIAGREHQFDDGSLILASAALTLAHKLDQAHDSDSGASAAAAPALARQLVDVIADLRGDVDEPDALDDLQRRREARRLALASTADKSKRGPKKEAV